ncbi:DUF5009 domain-containing protein [Mucilaginibacter mali]|uniref:DUF5009 domain-containing protein n=1 Tax=Mucilaginibacter mali TaxID=2740462 RepID=A0A7D4Q882_9SPHI|nr:DUF5009 domain-containing protein [Mucilaginibacter mali]QKJ30591.1 DUF5009 domain-containing protein [Mucilaginibacter mali]
MRIIPVASPEVPAKKNPRLASLDALRGFDMFWIISGEEIFHGLANTVKDKYGLARNPINWRIATDDRLNFGEQILVGISNQLHHSPWNGFTFYDLIFPLFIFISGISMAFSYGTNPSHADATTKKKRYTQLVKRTIWLILLGMVVNGLFRFQSYEQTRFASVLGRIGLACFFAAIIYLNTSLRGQIIWFTCILAGYWLLMTMIIVPGHGAGVLTPEGNLASYIDQHLLPGKLHRKVYDPEGLLSTIPAIATAMLGLFTGRFLRWETAKLKPMKKMYVMAGASVMLILLGLAWDMVFPINKTMWTSSFVLYAGGWSLLLFAVFYGLADVAGYQKWCVPMVWIGTNSILIYVAVHGLIGFEATAQYLLGGLITRLSAAWQHAIVWTGVLAIQLLLLRFVYIRKLFLKL